MSQHDNPPALLLERAALGELPEDIAAAYRERSIDLEEAKARLRDSDREILETYPPRDMAAAITARARSGTRAPRPGGSWSGSLWSSSVAWRRAGALAATALVLFTLSPLLLPEPVVAPAASSIEDTVRLKGLEPRLSIWRKRTQGAAEQLMPRREVRAGDVLQIKYRAAGFAHGVIASLDGRGSVTLHFPTSPEGSTRLKKGGDVALEYGYDLDDAPRFERFFFVVAERPLDVPHVLSKIRALEGSDAPEHAEIRWSSGQRTDEFLLYKVTP